MKLLFQVVHYFKLDAATKSDADVENWSWRQQIHGLLIAEFESVSQVWSSDGERYLRWWLLKAAADGPDGSRATSADELLPATTTDSLPRLSPSPPLGSDEPKTHSDREKVILLKLYKQPNKLVDSQT